MNIIKAAAAVIASPRRFFAQMPKTGGFGQPLLFLVAMGALAGLARAALYFLGLRPGLAAAAAMGAVVLVPLLMAVLGFVGAAVLFVIWKLLGSGEGYETAYRCMAYAAAVAPFNALLGAVPVFGTALGFAWSTVLVIAASVEVHHIRAGAARLVFGGLWALAALASVGAELAGRALSGAAAGTAAPLQQMAARMQAGALKAQAQAAQLEAAQAQLMQAVQAQAQRQAQAGGASAPVGLTADQRKQLQQAEKAMQSLGRQFQMQGMQKVAGQQQ